MSYIPDKIIKPRRIKLPKTVLNRLTNRLGMANIMSHNTINSEINPTTKFVFFFIESKNDIYTIIYPLLKKWSKTIK